MLQAINDRIKGWLGGLVIILITIPFAFWGIESYLGGGGKDFAAIVNGEEIPVYQFERNYAVQLSRLNQQYGKNLPISNQQIKQQVLDQMINSALLQDGTYSSGYRISSTQLKDSIKQIFNRDGVFDRDLFGSYLASESLSVSQYESSLKQDLRVLQKRNAIMASSLVTNDEAKQLAAVDQQTRDISMAIFSIDAHKDDAAVSEEDIKEYYETNSGRFMTEAKVSVEYVELKAADLENDIAIDEGRVEDMYNLYKSNAINTEERRASHILLTTGTAEDKSKDVVIARMQELQKKLEAGEAFEDLARDNSEDPGSATQGGDLDWVARGQMVKPFEDALFALNKGEVSGIVETQFGLHLIRLDDVRAPEFASFEEKRAELEQELKQEVISSVFYDVSENLAVTAYENPDSLDAVVDVLSIPVKQTEMFTRHNGEDIAANAKFREAAFSASVLEGGSNSDIIEIAPDHVVVLRVLKNEPASRQPLSEVESNIRSIIELKRAYENTMAAAQQAKDKVASGASLESVVDEGWNVQMYTGIKRQQTGEPGPEVVRAVFSMPDPASGVVSVENVNLASGDVALVVLDKVHTPVDIAEDSLNRVKQQRKSDVASAEFGFALTSLQDAAEIERNSAVLQ